MLVKNMTHPDTGKPVNNQFILTLEGYTLVLGKMAFSSATITVFQSYETVGAVKRGDELWIDLNTWNALSVTTERYLTSFTGLTEEEIADKIVTGEIQLAVLN